MTKHTTHLTIYNVDVYLDQINKYTTKDTTIKLKTRAANFYKKTGGIKYTTRAINLLEEAYALECELRGQYQSRAYNILSNLVICEKRLEKFKLNKKNNKKDKN